MQIDRAYATITTKKLSATNTNGERIKVSSYKGSKIYGYNHGANDAHDYAAQVYVTEYFASNEKDKLIRGNNASSGYVYVLVGGNS